MVNAGVYNYYIHIIETICIHHTCNASEHNIVVVRLQKYELT